MPKGSLEISAEYHASAGDVKRIQAKIVNEWNAMADKGITQAELDRVLNFLKLKMAQDDRKAESWAEWLATHHVCGRQVLTSSAFSSAVPGLADVNALLGKYQALGTSVSVVFH